MEGTGIHSLVLLMFVFCLQDLEHYKAKPIHIQLEDDHLVFWRPYKLNVFERVGA